MSSFALFRLQNEDIHLLEDTKYEILEIKDDKFVCDVLFTIRMHEGLYKGTLEFIIRIPKGYPYDPPKVLCKTRIYHPNVDEEGRVCLEILREGWGCGFGLENIFVNLYCVLMEPSSVNALNVEAGEMMEKDYGEFERRVLEYRSNSKSE